jgi:hypothetical protein
MKNQIKVSFFMGVIFFNLLISCQNKKEFEISITTMARHLGTNPPIPEMDVPYQKFEIEPSQPQVLYSKYGTKINIPSDAFLDINGLVIKDKVELSLREFYNPLDFYLVGIPMNINDNGVDKVLESGGMIELIAKSGQSELFVNPENKIKVDLYSWTKSKDFNMYDLDKKSGKWIVKGKDSIGSKTTNNDLDALQPIPPLPKVATPYSFSIKDETDTFPELKEYENVLFDPVDPAKCNISNAPEISVKPLLNGVFEVTASFKLGGVIQEKKCECYLAFEKGNDYKKAIKIYQKKYSKLLKERELIRNKIKKQWNDYYEVVNLYRKHDVKKLIGEEKIIRSLTINNFGFVNCDRPIDYPKGEVVTPVYIDGQNNPIVLENVVLVQKNTNALFRYTSTIKYNPDDDNLLWGLTKEKKIAYFKNEDFKELAHSKTKQVFRMHVCKENLNSYEEIMKTLF